MDLKPIETLYQGWKFRSRLEARWAVFFDALGIRWEYEHEGFVLADGTWYLPDFWLPTFDGGIWAEVKPIGGDFQKAEHFARDTHQSIWLCEGTPALRAYHVLEWLDDKLIPIVGIPNADRARDENRMYSYPGYENDDLSIPPECYEFLGQTFIRAVEAARSARFEAPTKHDHPWSHCVVCGGDEGHHGSCRYATCDRDCECSDRHECWRGPNYQGCECPLCEPF